LAWLTGLSGAWGESRFVPELKAVLLASPGTSGLGSDGLSAVDVPPFCPNFLSSFAAWSDRFACVAPAATLIGEPPYGWGRVASAVASWRGLVSGVVRGEVVSGCWVGIMLAATGRGPRRFATTNSATFGEAPASVETLDTWAGCEVPFAGLATGLPDLGENSFWGEPAKALGGSVLACPAVAEFSVTPAGLESVPITFTSASAPANFPSRLENSASSG
jgi:hypothetical protein